MVTRTVSPVRKRIALGPLAVLLPFHRDAGDVPGKVIAGVFHGNGGKDQNGCRHDGRQNRQQGRKPVPAFMQPVRPRIFPYFFFPVRQFHAAPSFP